MTTSHLSPLARNMVTAASLMAAFMTQLDGTIANVALPHMQASTSASREQITWVLTSYIIMAAMFTPLTGWLAERFGQKPVMLVSVLGFTAASMLCGTATSFGQLIAFRLLQGMMGSALLPISQAILLDINPPERHGSAMALWGIGAVLGPILGPVLGGYLTDYLSWRWIFFINLPFGLIAALGLALFHREARERRAIHLDLLGFGLLALSVGTFQLVLDRGQIADWFESPEIWIEATVSATAMAMFVVHTLLSPRPFVKPALFADPNYLIGNMLAFVLGGLLFSVMALTPPMLVELMGYPIKLVGLISAPRGITMMVTMLIVGKLVGRVDARLMIAGGLLITAAAMGIMASVNLEMDTWPMLFGGMVQGLGGGLMFVPVTTVIFATLAPEHRNEGAAVSSLMRNMSGSIWISVLHTMTIRNAAVAESRLVEGVRPDNPAMALLWPDFDPSAIPHLAGMNGEVMRQAMMLSYSQSFWFLLVACLVATPFVVFLRR